MLKTDLSGRERIRFSKALRAMAKAADKLANAIESENDTEAIFCFLMLNLEGHTMNELGAVFIDAAKADYKTTDPDEFEKIAKRIESEGK